MSALLVAVGAALGAPSRLLVAHFLDGRTPWGTLGVNLLGSALLGWLVGHGVDAHPLALLGTGFCGAFTTYSAVALQAAERGRWHGALYAVGTVLGGVVVAWAAYRWG